MMPLHSKALQKVLDSLNLVTGLPASYQGKDVILKWLSKYEPMGALDVLDVCRSSTRAASWGSLHAGRFTRSRSTKFGFADLFVFLILTYAQY